MGIRCRTSFHTSFWHHILPVQQSDLCSQPRVTLSLFTQLPQHVPISGSRHSSNTKTETNSPKPPVLGILGGIGSGKSSVVRQVNGFSLHIVDADKIGHQLLSNSEIQRQLRTHFGDEIFSQDSTVNRSALAARVFGETKEHESARLQLNEILHPAIRREIHSEIDSVSRDVDAVILDAALLLEGGWDATCNWLIFVDTPKEVREQRVFENRGWSAEELARREASQWSIDAKKDRADFIVDNSGLIDEAAAQMKQIFTSLISTPN